MKDFINSIKLICNKCDNTNERIKWDEYFASMALLAASRSPCERLHVGCVIVKDNRVLSMGYNGFFSGSPHISIIRDGHELATIHAEQNAIAHAAKQGISLKGAVAYITHYPCVNCFKILVAAGIEKVYYIDDYKNDPVNLNLSNVSNVTIEKII
tara:strand:+ start:569 stop:1033 length:465 start_codon:yes stop_codon:yes gene_type:complete